MMTMHPAHALLLAKQLHHERVERAEASRFAGLTAAASDCLIPLATTATKRCRPDPRPAAGPAGQHRSRSAAVRH